MFRSLSSLVLAVPVLVGCAAQPAATEPQRAYSDAEVKAFALKILSASNMDSELYARYRRALTEPHHERNNDTGS
ncbi:MULTISPECIES: hypothetical protein [unclassified Pseudomonas]|uniref:hypothetical protein n=1 Tax=unclassified Pseudomonas TaxID=196821 RepID=UPI0004D5B620|nr:MULTISPECIES: hypothetical protein [unclassified Pseudomonas]KES25536.1 lipoprotein [Pseudomonas sp. AAC]OHR89098.1 hypothetical protein HMPREF3289_22965 [Pseudomonas sp. HMSC75E02]